MRKTLNLFLLLIVACTSLQAQEIFFERYGESVEFLAVIPYNDLVFQEGRQEAEYQFSVSIKDSNGRQAASLERTLLVPRKSWMKDQAIPLFFREKLSPGKYIAQIRLRNLLLGGKSNLERSFSVGASSTQIGQAFLVCQKEGLEFIPSGMNALGFPLEAFQIRQSHSLPVDSLLIRLDDVATVHYPEHGNLNIDIVSLVNELQPEHVSLTVFEGNIRYEMEPFFYNKWFTYNQRYSYKDQIEQLRYVANQNEWRSLRAVPKADYQEAIERFWQVHDPTPGTIRNEARESFNARVITADERFTLHKRLKGWRSDRGRIYIKYGEPDEILAESQPLDEDPYIMWIYYKEKLEFIFTDSGGYGQYKLRNKDEEL